MKPASTDIHGQTRCDSRHDCRMRALPAPPYLLSADCPRQAQSLPRRHLLGRPVPGFGDPLARLLLVGLAPAAHGANRTGRVFTGDGNGGSGDFLMTALNRTGFASIPTSSRIDDGLALYDAYIVMAVRCAPPDNAPEPEEIARCLDHLDAEVAELARAQVVVALGKIAFDVWLRLLKRRGATIGSPRPQFGHRSAGTSGRAQPSPRDRARVLPPKPSEHKYRKADAGDDGKCVQEGERAVELISVNSQAANSQLPNVLRWEFFWGVGGWELGVAGFR